jgi:peptidoglycan/LPS O-acetylase OafA/YrhL
VTAAAAPASDQRSIPYEASLDGLRALSIVAVLLFHACATAGLPGWFRGGGLGVSVFFTLSGFLITSLLMTEVDRRGQIDVVRFWTRRMRRLAPAALVTVLAVLVVGRSAWLTVRRADAVAAVWSATNWHVILAGRSQLLHTIVGPLGPTWSLAVEEQFYVLLAIVVVLAAWTRRPDRTLAVVFGTVVLATIALANTVSDVSPRLEFGTDVRAGELAIGGLVALAVRRARVTRPAGGRAPRAVLAADGAGVAAALTIGWLITHATYSPPWLLRGGFCAVAVASGTLIVAGLAHGRLAAVLSWSPLVALGRTSYALYLVHWPVILVMSPERTGWHGWILVAARAMVALGLATALHLGVEQPVRSMASLGARRTTAWWLAGSAAVTLAALALGR